MYRCVVMVAVLAAACAEVKPYPAQYAACFERLQRDAAQLLPGFESQGFRPAVHLQMDEDMRGGRGFRKANDVMGDAVAGGLIRVRPSRVCANPAVGRAVVAHEMAHVALRHKGMPDTGLILEWDGMPQQEQEADALALKVLRHTGGPRQAEHFIECRRLVCDEASAAFGSPPAFRYPAQ